jgi:hypothetical protein
MRDGSGASSQGPCGSHGRADVRLERPEHYEGRRFRMAKKSRGGRMTAAKKRAAKAPGGRGSIKKRKVGKKIMKT